MMLPEETLEEELMMKNSGSILVASNIITKIKFWGIICITIVAFTLFIVFGIAGALPMFVIGFLTSHYQEAAVGLAAFFSMLIAISFLIWLIDEKMHYV